MRLMAILLLTALAGCGQDPSVETSPAEGVSRGSAEGRQARAFMQRFESGDFFLPEVEGAPKASGWKMANEKGHSFNRSLLDLQAEKIVPLGREAVPELVRWLAHDEMQIRYIAHRALEQITFVRPTFPHFATLAQLKTNRWLEESRNAWMSWYRR